MDLQKLVYNDIVVFLRQNNTFFFNEWDFQLHLAIWLKKSDHYCDVDVEYTVPLVAINTMPPIHHMEKVYPWNTELKIDIVVKKDNEYCPIELKYKTRSPKTDCMINRFGEQMCSSSLVKNQGAQDLGMYGFWKDVYRIELLKRRFPAAVKGGLCIFLTNDNSYKCKNKKNGTNDADFSMKEGMHEPYRIWRDANSKIAKDYPGFVLSSQYEIKWNEHNCNYISTIVKI
ncbi:MAG: hypothetical protein MJZ22_03110 [Candidatus Saccharibacteria bacterium]|nr:hypothetical protein [Candidatus Saccharibacteria bacterium]